MHAHALGRVERRVGDVARERVTEVDELPLPVAEAARAEPDDGLVVASRRQLDRSVRGKGPPAIASQSTTACSSAGSSRRRSPSSCSSVEGSAPNPASPRSVRARTDRRSPRSAPSASAGTRRRARPTAGRAVFPDLERAALEERVDHLEQEERVAPHLGQQVGADLPSAVANPEPRLDEAHLLVRHEAAKLDAHHALEHVHDAIVVARDEQHQDGQRLGPVRDLADDVEARLVAPVHALDHQHQRLRERDGREQVADAREDVLLARVRVLVAPAEPVGRQLREARDHGAGRVPSRRGPSGAGDERDHLVEGLLARGADGAAHELGHGRVGHLHRHRRALDVQQARVAAAARRGTSPRGRSCRCPSPRRPRGRRADRRPSRRRRSPTRGRPRGGRPSRRRAPPDRSPRPAPRRGALRARGCARARTPASSGARRGPTWTRGATSARRPSGSRVAPGDRRRRPPRCAPPASRAPGRRRDTPWDRAGSSARDARATSRVPVAMPRTMPIEAATGLGRSSLKPAMVS